MAKGRVSVDRERCKGCGYCINFCKNGVLMFDKSLNKKGLNPIIPVELEKCTGCTLCAVVCPEVCIEVYREE